jgi:hypothetical protein
MKVDITPSFTAIQHHSSCMNSSQAVIKLTEDQLRCTIITAFWVAEQVAAAVMKWHEVSTNLSEPDFRTLQR